MWKPEPIKVCKIKIQVVTSHLWIICEIELHNSTQCFAVLWLLQNNTMIIMHIRLDKTLFIVGGARKNNKT